MRQLICGDFIAIRAGSYCYIQPCNICFDHGQENVSNFSTVYLYNWPHGSAIYNPAVHLECPDTALIERYGGKRIDPLTGGTCIHGT